MTGWRCAFAVLLALPLVARAADSTAPPALQNLDVVEHLGEKIPLGLAFTDAQGHPVRLSDLLGRGIPVVMTLGYHRCPMLCDLVLSGLNRAFRQLDLQIGRDFVAVSVSIDPTETRATAAERQRGNLQTLGQTVDPAAWPFLVGAEPQIRALADSVGFKYVFDAASKQYAHDAVAFVITPDGTVSRYLYGVEFGPADVKRALIEAGGGRVGTTLERLLLQCYRWDPSSRRYGLYVSRFLQGGGLLVFAGLASLLGMLWRRELRREGSDD